MKVVTECPFCYRPWNGKGACPHCGTSLPREKPAIENTFTEAREWFGNDDPDQVFNYVYERWGTPPHRRINVAVASPDKLLPLQQWGEDVPMPLADFEALRETIMQHCTPLVAGKPMQVQIDLNRHPVHLISEGFIDALTVALDGYGFTVTREPATDGGWFVDWQPKETP